MASISFHGNNHGIQLGYNCGSINAEFHLPPGKSGIAGLMSNTHHRYFTLERPETPPLPLSNVPFPRDPHHVIRDPLLHEIHAKSSVPGSRIALVGLGGVG